MLAFELELIMHMQDNFLPQNFDKEHFFTLISTWYTYSS